MGFAIAKKTPSFLIECLVWNADVDAFSRDTCTAIVPASTCGFVEPHAKGR